MAKVYNELTEMQLEIAGVKHKKRKPSTKRTLVEVCKFDCKICKSLKEHKLGVDTKYFIIDESQPFGYLFDDDGEIKPMMPLCERADQWHHRRLPD
jgi:hypothetical protein